MNHLTTSSSLVSLEIRTIGTAVCPPQRWVSRAARPKTALVYPEPRSGFAIVCISCPTLRMWKRRTWHYARWAGVSNLPHTSSCARNPGTVELGTHRFPCYGAEHDHRHRRCQRNKFPAHRAERLAMPDSRSNVSCARGKSFRSSGDGDSRARRWRRPAPTHPLMETVTNRIPLIERPRTREHAFGRSIMGREVG